MSKGTTPTQIRLTEDDKAAIDRIRRRFGLPSGAAAIRYAIETVRGQIEAEGTAGKKPRKSGVRA